LKITGVILIVVGVIWALLGFATYSSDIQLGIALSGICIAGIGYALIGISRVREDLHNIWLWIKKIDKSED
jgi:hypothetical protein